MSLGLVAGAVDEMRQQTRHLRIVQHLSLSLEHAKDLSHETQHLEHTPRGLPQTQGVARVPHQQVRVLHSNRSLRDGHLVGELRDRSQTGVLISQLTELPRRTTLTGKHQSSEVGGHERLPHGPQGR